MKTVVSICNSARKGKSSTILEFANLLMSHFHNHKIIYSSKKGNSLTIDFRLIIEINGKVIALESQGDPGTHLEIRLNDIVNTYQPNLIICSARTRGETVSAIKTIAKQYAYDKIWTSTYETSHSHQQVNVLKAEHLLDLILKMRLI